MLTMCQKKACDLRAMSRDQNYVDLYSTIHTHSHGMMMETSGGKRKARLVDTSDATEGI